MATNTDALMIPGTGQIWIAPADTAEPTAAPATPWVDLGHTSEEGITLNKEVTREPRPTWQARSGARTAITEETMTVAFVALQVDETSLKLYFGGGSVDIGPPVRFQIPKAAAAQEHALYVLMQDGANAWPFYFPRAEIAADGESEGNPEGYFTLPLSCTVLASDLATFLGTIGGPGITAA